MAHSRSGWEVGNGPGASCCARKKAQSYQGPGQMPQTETGAAPGLPRAKSGTIEASKRIVLVAVYVTHLIFKHGSTTILQKGSGGEDLLYKKCQPVNREDEGTGKSLSRNQKRDILIGSVKDHQLKLHFTLGERNKRFRLKVSAQRNWSCTPGGEEQDIPPQGVSPGITWSL